MSVELIEEIPGQSCYPSRRKWRCRCSCGTEFEVLPYSVKSGNTKSCGCLQRKRASETKTTHGQGSTRTHNSWANMVQRCTNPNHKNYPDYGGRGIRVCDRWRKFENFYADMGEPPTGRSLDRVDNSGDYCPENCRWATLSQQGRNQRSNKLLTLNGETHCQAEWSEKTGISQKTINKRLSRGWSVKDALTTPVKPRV